MSKYTLVLRTVNADMTSRDGFLWPAKGPVECADWDPTPKCGGGLHGLAWGMGDATVIPTGQDRKWLVVRVLTSDLVEFERKVKFRRGTVVHCGDQISATDYLVARAPAGTVCHYHHARSGYRGTSTSGWRGTSTSGYGGTSTSGNRGTSTSGYGGTSTSGYGGTSTSGDDGTSTSGDYGTSTSGNRGTSTSGDGGRSTSGWRGTSTSGHRGRSTSGYGGTSTSGYGGTSTSGNGGRSTSGDEGTSTSGNGGRSTSGDGGRSTSGNRGKCASGENGELHIRWWDGERYRAAIAYVGEDGIEPGVLYKLDGDHKFVRVDR